MSERRRSIFVSYSNKDTIWLEELRPHLVALAREKQIEEIDDALDDRQCDFMVGSRPTAPALFTDAGMMLANLTAGAAIWLQTNRW